MELAEILQKKLNEYFEGVRQGDFNDYEKVPGYYTYGHLLGLFYAIPNIKNGKELFSLFYRFIKSYSRKKLSEKYKRNEKIKIAFLAISAVEWPSEKLYRALESDDRFDVYVIGHKLVDRPLEISNRTYGMLRNKFGGVNYRFVDGVDRKGRFLTWDKIGVPDICIHLTPWWESIEEKQSLINLPISTVNLHIPYGVYVENNEAGDYLDSCVYNKDFMNVMDTIFMDTSINEEGFKNRQILCGENIKVSGYAKMDFFYDEHSYSCEDIKKMWKIPEGKDATEIKKVIIAPHHSIGNTTILQYSTFDKNYNFLYYLAKKYSDVSFIFKPHPNLRGVVTQTGLMSLNDYENYLKKWNDLPNAKVVDEASYLDLFKTSDGLILDCISFMTEYLYVDKPVLFLTRRGQARNKLGEEIFKALYKTDGEDFLGIEDFIRNQIVDGIDDMSGMRKEIYNKYLDYKSHTGKLAYEYIYNTIEELLLG